MSKPDGGQAFPIAGDQDLVRRDGMTLRDYFAGQAMTGLLAAYSGQDTPLPAVRMAAAYSYDLADAMLTEREK